MNLVHKALDFVNILEDDDIHLRLSQTKLTLWGATFGAFITYWSAVDHQTQALATGAAVLSWVKAEVKRRTNKL